MATECLRTALENNETVEWRMGGLNLWERRDLMRSVAWDVDKAMAKAAT